MALLVRQFAANSIEVEGQHLHLYAIYLVEDWVEEAGTVECFAQTGPAVEEENVRQVGIVECVPQSGPAVEEGNVRQLAVLVMGD